MELTDEQKKGNPLRVTRGGVPVEDQAQGVADFKAACQPGERYYEALGGGKAAAVDRSTASDGAKAVLGASSANARQVDGSHYAAEYQHWDFVRDMALDYLQGCGSKYVTRWRKKNGMVDLNKSLHYIQKRKEDPNRPVSADAYWGPGSYGLYNVFRFTRANGLGIEETEAIMAIVLGDWDKATEAVNVLIEMRKELDAQLLGGD